MKYKIEASEHGVDVIKTEMGYTIAAFKYGTSQMDNGTYPLSVDEEGLRDIIKMLEEIIETEVGLKLKKVKRK